MASAIAAVHVTAATAQLPLEPRRESGQSVTPAFEGWFKNADGTFSLLVGYYNRNAVQTLDIPIGPNNRIDPGAPDRGQPTHFLSRRQWGVFTIVVPSDFGDKKITWTLTANGKTLSVPMALNPLYEVDPFKDAGLKNTPPVLRVDRQGPFQGPPRGIGASLAATSGKPLTLTLTATDDAVVDPRRPAGEKPLTVSWSEYRGPGAVTFSGPRSSVGTTEGTVTTTATFSAPGEYILRAQANDVTGEGGGGFQCCWTNVLVRVMVKD